MDEGNPMMSQGWQRKSVLVLIAGLFVAGEALCASLTIREITLNGNNSVEIQFDRAVNKGMLELDFVRDIAQLSIQNATIYPAKILHADQQTFSKVFAYQYAPSLVRVRFTVQGLAGQYQGKVDTHIQGNKLTVKFPSAAAPAAAQDESAQEAAKESALLAKIERAEKAEKTEKKSKKSDKSGKGTADQSPDQSLTGKPSASLAGAKPGPSALRSIFAMVLIVGGLAGVLWWVKRKKNAQATRVGNGWFSNLLPQAMRKQKSLIEVVAQHALGPKQSLTIVRIRGQQFILGVTQDSVQLISQIDADEAEVDLLEDPAVAASLGRMFGAAPSKPARENRNSIGATFANLLKSSGQNPSTPEPRVTSGRTNAAPNPTPQMARNAAPNTATAAMGRQQYAAQTQAPATPAVSVTRNASPSPGVHNGIREQIRKRLEGARS